MRTLQDIQMAVNDYLTSHWKYEIDADTKTIDEVRKAVEYTIQSGEVFSE